MSIASTNDPTGVITAAKIATANSAQWILRVYQPTNQSSNMQINIDPNIAASFLSGGNLNVAAASAMENAIDGLGIQYRFLAVVIHLHCAARVSDG